MAKKYNYLELDQCFNDSNFILSEDEIDEILEEELGIKIYDFSDDED